MAIATARVTGAEGVHWNLGDLYPGDAAASIETDLSRADELARTFESAMRGRVAGLSPDELRDALQQLEEIQEIVGRAGSYAGLQFSTDMSDPVRGALMQKVEEAGTQLATHLLFFDLEWLAVPDERAEELLADPALDNYRHHLRSARRYKPHVLSEPEEKVMTEKRVTARSAWDRLFEEACGAIRVALDGGELTLDQALSELYSAEQSRRAEVQEAVTTALRTDLRTRRYIVNTILADKSIDDRLRDYPHWIAERNLDNEASDESVAALIDAVTSRYDIPQRYYALKRKLLGLERFFDYDRYAPYGADEPEVGWDEARETVLDAYGSFSPRLRDLALDFFANNWIDAPPSPNKRGGAFAHHTIPSVHPYVMLNYTGRRRDVLTLAHELGHGVHMSLSRKQTVFNFETPLTTAETASIFGETVTFNRLLAIESDPAQRLSLTVGRIDDAVGSIFRQVAMNRFEDTIHNLRRSSGELSEEQLNAAWYETQQSMLGAAVEITDNYRIWWSYIPHFIFAPGYVYAYAFGNLLALAISKRSEEEGPAFADRYFELLAAGGSDSPEALTAKVGIDLADPRFWHGGLETIDQLVTEAEELSLTV